MTASAICSRLGGTHPFRVSTRLNAEQRQVVEFVLDSHDRAINLSGAAGTGKTATLQELRRGLLESGQTLIAVAPTRSAVDELKKVGFQDAFTIERLLQDKRLQASLDNKVLIVDEAGMVSGRQMWEMLRLSELYSARIVFSGDTKQIQSVEACDALRVLEKESRLRTIELNHVQRQITRDYREAMKELRLDPGRGFEKLDKIGAIREVPWLERAQEVAKAFSEAEALGQDSLMVCATHEEIDRVTHAIRMSQGKAGKGVQIGKDVSLNWTAAQKSDMANYQPGQLLVFHRAVKGIRKNETLEVVNADGQSVTARNAIRPTFTVTARQAKSFDVCERQALEITPGDKLLLTANRRESRFPGHQWRNRDRASRSIPQSAVHLTDGRILPPDFKQFTHGYAVTAHRSQGKSVDSVIISADGMPKELFYVAASRGRQNVLIITSDKQTLSESVCRSNARQSASELARGERPGLYQGLHRGFQAACNLVRWAAQYARHWGNSIAEPAKLPEPMLPDHSPAPLIQCRKNPRHPKSIPPAPSKEPATPVEIRSNQLPERRTYDLEIER